MSNASKYRKKAVEYEQLKQFDRAVASYVRAIEENESAGEEVDVALFNKVGDLTLRQGRVTEAVTYYERAVEHYVSNTLFDNAIALCNKILRNAPGRSNVYFTLGRICGRKGLRSDATRNFLEYAKRMQQDGRVDDGMRALAEVADLMPELTEVRRFVEEHAARAGISLAPRRRNTPARSSAPADAEPPRAFGLSKNLVFLEIDYDVVRAAREKTPPPQRSVAPEPVTPSRVSAVAAPRTASLEDLVIFDPNADAAAFDDDALETMVVDGASILKPYADTTAPVASLIDLEPTELIGTPVYTEAIDILATIVDTSAVSPGASDEATNRVPPAAVVKVATVPNFPAVLESGDFEPLDTVASEIAEELLFDTPRKMLDDLVVAHHDILIVEDVETLEPDDLSLVAHTAEADVLPSLDFDAMLELAQPDSALVADLQTEDFALASDELAVVRFVRAEEESVAQLVDEFESTDELPPLIFPMPSHFVPRDEIILQTAIVPDEFVDDEIVTDVTDVTDIVFLEIPDVDGDASRLTPLDLEVLETPLTSSDAAFELLDDTLPSNAAAFELLTDAVDSLPLLPDDLDDLFGDTDLPTAIIAAEATLVASSRCAELRAASDAEPDNFALRRRLAEALFEAGDRDDGITELGAALAVAELAGALADAADIADELVHVAGDEVAHHQKRLELAIRLGDQTRLRDAYLDLADNLVRRGEDLRAKAVYARVLEIDPWDHRARTALGDSAPPAPAKPPVAGSDGGQVSLADWLRDDDEPVSTRLRMREPDISGDEQDDFNALLKHFKEGVARSLGEDDYESHYDLGVAYKEMGLLDDAIGEFQMALRGRSNRLATYEALGQCFIEQQSYKVAVTVLSRALHEPTLQDDQRIGVLYLLGISCEVLQRFDEARGYFQRVYATDIHFRDVNQRLADLERTVR